MDLIIIFDELMGMLVLLLMYFLNIEEPGLVKDILSSQIKYRLYTGSDISSYHEFEHHDFSGLLSHSAFFVDRPTMFYIHGFIEHPGSWSVQNVTQAYLNRGDHNVLVVDWSELAGRPYTQAVLRVSLVAENLAQLVLQMRGGGLMLNRTHFVGHSLGGQVVGRAGREMHPDKVARVTALDPAYPLFYLLHNHSYVRHTDADFVDIIHTDGGHYGASLASGHVDFFPNGGVGIQPGCPPDGAMLSPDELCSHWRSWRFYTESLSSNSLLAWPCDSWSSFESGGCDRSADKAVVMGAGVDQSIRGKYYLYTNSAPPFGRGLRGIASESDSGNTILQT